MHVFNVEGQEFQLLAERALIWTNASALLLSDIHIGKIAHFRKSGMALPRHAEQDNYDRLATLLLNYPVARVLILGDLFHSSLNSEWDNFRWFMEQFENLRFELVHGNHDILPEESYAHPKLKILGEIYEEGPFIFTHKPLDKPDKYNIYGHIHPGIRLQGTGRQSMRLPCFRFMPNSAVLPAFGSFTGLHCITPKKEDKLFVISQNAIIPVS